MSQFPKPIVDEAQGSLSASLPGSPPVSETVPVLRPRLPSADRLLPYLRRIDATRTYSNHGPLVLEFEERLAKHLRLGPRSVVATSSGTAALVGAILAVAGRPTGKRRYAVVPAYTFVATPIAVEQCGYSPYLADIDPLTWMLDPAAIPAHPERDLIGLVVPVSPFGRPVPLEPWLRFRDVTGIPVVIDAAASFEGISDAPARLLGDIPIALSFHATKSFATGEGGGVVTSNSALAERVVQALNFGFYGSRDSQLASTNGKMSEYHAAVGLAELDAWDDKRMALEAVAQRYRQRLGEAGLADRFFGAPEIAGCYCLFWCKDRNEAARVQVSLERHRIDFRLWYGAGVHRHTYFAEAIRQPLEVTGATAPCILGLPVAPDLSETAITRVASALAAAL